MQLSDTKVNFSSYYNQKQLFKVQLSSQPLCTSFYEISFSFSRRMGTLFFDELSEDLCAALGFSKVLLLIVSVHDHELESMIMAGLVFKNPVDWSRI